MTSWRVETEPGKLHIEAIGIAPYTNHLYPRVVGFIRPMRSKLTAQPEITYVVGDATEPRGSGLRLISHIVNDKTPNWGAGFAAVVRKKWPLAQEDFQVWAKSNKENLRLGNVHFTRLETRLTLCHMISQHGYGPSKSPRIRYNALANCLEQLRAHATANKASVHMPRIGTGQAGGSWPVVEELLREILIRAGVPISVYDLRGAKPDSHAAEGQLFSRA